MKILVIGGGGREHALCQSLSKSASVKEIICAPGNVGIAEIAKCIDIGVTQIDELVAYALNNGVDLTVVGPEASLALGVVDAFQREALPIVGPTRAAAKLESSKSFAKEIMSKAQVPTADYRLCKDRQELEAHCGIHGLPLVLKVDGLASGKGVFVVHTDEELKAAISQLYDVLQADSVVVEDFLQGFEVSCIFASNGKSVIPLAPAHDYKRLQENDEGPNTGGMGSVCPTPRIGEELLEWIKEHCAQPIIEVMRERGEPFVGFLYAGLMIDPTMPPEKGIRVLEYNTRLGDPECQAICARLESDPVELFEWISGRSDTEPLVRWSNDVTVCVVIASDGYPENVKKGDAITGLELVSLVPDVSVLHAATVRDAAGTLQSGGGRTLCLVAKGKDLESARATVYKAVDLVQLRGRRVRRDIGAT